MQKRKLGNSSLMVSPICFGGNVFGWTADDASSFKLLDAFTAAGGNFIDTADVYAKWVGGNQGSESETIIGASNFSAARLAESLKVARTHRLPAYVSLQPEYSLYRRAGYEIELEPVCRRENVGVIGYYSLASGFLSGKYRPGSIASGAHHGPGSGQRIILKPLVGAGFRRVAPIPLSRWRPSRPCPIWRRRS